MRGEQHIPKHGPGVHFVAEHFIVAQVRGLASRARLVLYAFVDCSSAVGVGQAAELFRAVDLPRHHVRKIHVVIGRTVAAADEDDRVAAVKRKALRFQRVPPGVEHTAFEPVQKFSRHVEPPERVMRDRERRCHRLVQRHRAKIRGNAVQEDLVTLAARADVRVAVASQQIHHFLQRREVKLERHALAFHQEVERSRPVLFEVGQCGNGGFHGGLRVAGDITARSCPAA